jgi:putative ABC transport system permease protein
VTNRVIPFKDEIMRSGKMENATMTGFLPVSGTWRNDNPWWVEGRDPAVQENMVSIQNWRLIMITLKRWV